MHEDDCLPLSALQHLAFCPRQCALIHVEQAWAENRSTAEGRLFHERTHEGGHEWHDDILITRGFRLISYRLGLAGIADVIEFHPDETGCRLPNLSGGWNPIPVEYKKGKPKRNDADQMQLCAQAMCLEEMLDVSIPKAMLFYGKPRRRLEVCLHADLRAKVEALSEKLHRLFHEGITPMAEYGPKCKLCSLREHCLPELPRNARDYVRTQLLAIKEGADETA